MSAFPKTPTALLTRIAADAAGEDEAVWTELVELYQPAMRGFLLKHGAQDSDVDDIMQNVFAKLVGILREGKYDKRRGRFRAYLSTLLFHELIGSVRKAQARMEHRRVPVGEDSAVVEPEALAAVEREWLAECHEAAVRHILENTALSETSKTVFRELERTGDTCEAVEARKRLEDCRHPFRVSGDAAVLKLGEFGEIDFVRCPTGTVELVLQWPKVRTRTVTISRPYWIAKYPLTRRQAAFFSPLDSQKGATPEERTDDYACVNRAMAEGLMAHFTRYFARALPTNTIVRLPTLAEWEHAYHAGTTDPSDPFFDLRHVHQGDAVYRAIAYDYDRQEPPRTKRLNAWGIGDWCGQEKVFDTFDPATLVRDAVRGTSDFYLVQSLPDPPCGADPCFSYAGTNRVSLIRLPFWCRWKAATDDFGEDWCPIRLVIAPPMGL